ncbi:uncharacterized protein LACBIDRAFT_307627 [Laccaria bicolor S238N-H82]|uniref:Predicted protein n=1 Tax=Laccaria bicolor (strain S238N-H82 / ATCC MYA-4686) TaxID=486041 RepID=B0DQL7_LACBS|nr:uncharacterized protein LACBIDRAFT_307627 [Laccaria bicolor S238N-H82]EDR03052.1 predicted protein [Laccaria bicolor S238N-H82]|eukprot:XP_001886193.1 predicted protein [Laccaria bicolor S238N-H82]
MEENQLDQDTSNIMADIEVDDLPDEIMDLFYSIQNFCSDAERQQVKDLTTIHKANLSTIRSRIDCIDDQIARLRSHWRMYKMRHTHTNEEYDTTCEKRHTRSQYVVLRCFAFSGVLCIDLKLRTQVMSVTRPLSHHHHCHLLACAPPPPLLSSCPSRTLTMANKDQENGHGPLHTRCKPQ